MAEGTETYMGKAVPINPKAGIEIAQASSTTLDLLTLTEAASTTGDFLVAQTSAGVEKFVVDASGKVTSSDVAITASAASATPLTINETGTFTGQAFTVKNTDGSKIFNINPAGAIRTMAAFSTVAVASIASNGSASYALAGATTDDAVFLLPLKTGAAASAAAYGGILSADKVTLFAPGVQVNANTYAMWIFNTVANSGSNG